ncbi:MAG TPA: hypothetical protein K8V44_03050 [Staphylococcus saprophyticus]|nr:hypothetical protein [Staphylococcus saprophyticus]
MKNIRNEIIREQLHRIKYNFVPALTIGVIVIQLFLVSGAFFVKSKIGSDSFIESLNVLITSPLPMIAIGFAGLITFIVCLLLEDPL